jgi:hypothetical protein
MAGLLLRLVLFAAVTMAVVGCTADNQAGSASPEQLTREFVAARYPDARVSNCRETGTRLDSAALVACNADRVTNQLRHDLEIDGKEPFSATPTACFTVFLRSEPYVVAHGFGSPDHARSPCFPLHD